MYAQPDQIAAAVDLLSFFFCCGTNRTWNWEELEDNRAVDVCIKLDSDTPRTTSQHHLCLPWPYSCTWGEGRLQGGGEGSENFTQAHFGSRKISLMSVQACLPINGQSPLSLDAVEDAPCHIDFSWGHVVTQCINFGISSHSCDKPFQIRIFEKPRRLAL